MRLSELQGKDIINVLDGKKIGNIIDVNIGLNGNIESFVVEKGRFFLKLFGREEVIVKFSQISKIGEDVILVNVDVL